MRQFEQLDLMLTDQDGMLQISQATAVGISKSVFYDYVKTRELERVAPGIYLSKRFLGGCHVFDSFTF